MEDVTGTMVPFWQGMKETWSYSEEVTKWTKTGLKQQAKAAPIRWGGKSPTPERDEKLLGAGAATSSTSPAPPGAEPPNLTAVKRETADGEGGPTKTGATLAPSVMTDGK
jgi:hypothetical protein